jgi:secreted trypsin-like serine protease
VGIYRKVSYYRDWISAVTQGLYSHDEAEEEEATSEQEE